MMVCKSCKHYMPIKQEENQPNSMFTGFCRKERHYLTDGNKQIELFDGRLCRYKEKEVKNG